MNAWRTAKIKRAPHQHDCVASWTSEGFKSQTQPYKHRAVSSTGTKNEGEVKERQSQSICYLCDLSASLKGMCNERFRESSTEGARGHP